jgi:hypothetical protein
MFAAATVPTAPHEAPACGTGTMTIITIAARQRGAGG